MNNLELLTTFSFTAALIALSSDFAYSADLYPPMKPPFHTLVDKGSVDARIVLPPTASKIERYAASELQEYLEKIAGGKLPIVAYEGESQKYSIYLCASDKIGEVRPLRKLKAQMDAAQLGKDGFLIQSLQSGPSGHAGVGLAIIGGTDLGALYGVFDFLERYMGVRWFMPGEIGEVAPIKETIVVGHISGVRRPDFTFRWIGAGDWALKNKMNINVKAGAEPVGVKWKWGFHSFFQLAPPDKYFDAHPEYFSLVGGKRRRPQSAGGGSQLCTSNPEVVREVAKNLRETLDNAPNIEVISLSPNDGGNFCECENCVALDEPERDWYARYSRRLAIFNNQVAKIVAQKHPDTLIKVGAYAMYLRVPLDEDYRPEKNLAVQVCHTYSCNNHPVASDRCERNRAMFRADFEKWCKICNHIFIYEYYHKGAWANLPWPIVHVIREDIPYYHRFGAEGFYTQLSNNNWHTMGLNYYVAAKLVWDASLDVDKLLDDYYEKFYREAAAPMKRYFTTLENAMVESDVCISPFGLKWVSLAAPEIFTNEVLAACDKHISEAERLARGERVKARIHMSRVTLVYTEMAMSYLAKIAEPFRGVKREDAEAWRKAAREARRIGEPLAEGIKSYLRKNGRGGSLGKRSFVTRFLSSHNYPGRIVGVE